jgi:predicted Zn finger-like uncharacterized protein
MIVKCEKCQSEFSLDESLLKKDGSKVRCSICKHIFRVFPLAKESFIESEEDEFSNTAMEETVALDLPPELEDLEMDAVKEEKEYSFDKAFEEAMEEVSKDEELIPSDDEIEEKTESVDEEEEEEDSEVDTGKKRGKSKTLLIVLSCILFLILALLAIFFLFPSVIPDSIYTTKHQETKQETKPVASSDASTAQLNFMGVKPAFSKSEKAGDLFLIKGTVINNDSKSRSYILLKGGILDKEGKLVREETGYAGNNFSDDQLKQLSREEIKAAMQNRSGIDNSNVEVKPGATLNFMIIFMDLPEKGRMADLTVEAVSSTAGK